LLKLGNRNTKFFHNAYKVRNHKNQLNHLIAGDGSAISTEDQLKKEAPLYYEKLFNTDHYGNTFPKLVVKNKLINKVARWLIRPVSDKEIKMAVFQFSPHKAPWAEGFNASFYQKH